MPSYRFVMSTISGNAMAIKQSWDPRAQSFNFSGGNFGQVPRRAVLLPQSGRNVHVLVYGRDKAMYRS